jgi:hypothetical protein
MWKYVILLGLLVGCCKTKNNGVTETVYSGPYATREDATKALKLDIKILCLKDGYYHHKMLKAFTYYKINIANGKKFYYGEADGQCLKE